MNTVVFTLLIFVVFPFFFVGLWSGVVFLLSYLSNWQKLAVRYQTSYFPEDVKWCSCLINRCRYSGTIRYAVSEKGLYLRTAKLFTLGHKPLFIPWESMEYETGGFYLFYPAKITVDGVTIYIGKDVQKELPFRNQDFV